jgi:hypothetical protein
MLVLYIGLAVASTILADWIRGRQYGYEWYDWSFIYNRKALIAGGVVSVCIFASTLGSRWQDILLSIIPALLVGSIVALSVDRRDRKKSRGR